MYRMSLNVRWHVRFGSVSGMKWVEWRLLYTCVMTGGVYGA